jgi:GTP-binding protein
MLPEEEIEQRCQEVVDRLNWTGPVHKISAMNKMGTEPMCGQILDYLEERWNAEREDPDLVDVEYELQEKMQTEARQRIDELRERHRTNRQEVDGGDDDDDWDEEEFDVDFEYVP